MDVLRNKLKEVYFITEPEEITVQFVKGNTNPICFIATEKKIDRATIEQTIVTMLEGGSTYFCTYGPSATLLHDLIDDLVVLSELEVLNIRINDFDVMTVGSNDEAMEESVHFFLSVAGAFCGKSCSYLAYAIGSVEFVNELKRKIQTAEL